MNASSLKVSAVQSVRAVDAGEWNTVVADRCAFLDHRWLAALEDAGCVGDSTGWTPCPLLVHRGDRLAGLAPAYLKTDSFGEFVYDWAWADFARRIRVPYYPKLVVTTPLSPITGPRLIVAPGEDAALVQAALVEGLLALARAAGASGVHVLFGLTDEFEALERRGFFARTHVQYHFHDRDFGDFEGFLAALHSKRRRETRRERRAIAERGIGVRSVAGDELDESAVDDLFRFYASTCDRHVYGRRYLNRDFFGRVIATMPEKIRAFFAFSPEGTRIAGTFNVEHAQTLYGRYWGSDVDVPLLHFETCFYAMIEYALAAKIHTIEPGAGGEHKRARGFEPTVTRSAHLLFDPRLHRALADFCGRERDAVHDEIDEMQAAGPFRRDRAG
jgi:predicted N-acyltransferase